jgi:N-carbamoyl-L-amino-acid hydrolase
MLTLADVIRTARAGARAHDALATVGKVRVHPGAVNAIPAVVSAWLDARGPVEDDVRAVVAAVAEAAGTAAHEESWTPPVAFGSDLVDRLVAAAGAGTPVLATGAGHDAGILAAAGVPAGMLFVRNPTGVSHSPAEHAEPADCDAGVAALARVLEDLA